jgi:hypothetical protein
VNNRALHLILPHPKHIIRTARYICCPPSSWIGFAPPMWAENYQNFWKFLVSIKQGNFYNFQPTTLGQGKCKTGRQWRVRQGVVLKVRKTHRGFSYIKPNFSRHRAGSHFFWSTTRPRASHSKDNNVYFVMSGLHSCQCCKLPFGQCNPVSLNPLGWKSFWSGTVSGSGLVHPQIFDQQFTAFFAILLRLVSLIAQADSSLQTVRPLQLQYAFPCVFFDNQPYIVWSVWFVSENAVFWSVSLCFTWK